MEKRTIFIVDDEDSIRMLIEHWITKKWGYCAKVFKDGESCYAEMDTPPDLVLLDIMLPGIGGVETLKLIKQRYPEVPVIMLSAQGRIEVAVDCIKSGALDYFSKPIEWEKLEIALKNGFHLHDLSREVARLKEMVDQKLSFDNIISSDGKMQSVYKHIQKVKDSDISVLIQGESGTGKELIARAIHYNGKRKDGPFIVVNCASIPKDLLESEFFGHERGAFTGAIQKKIGKFEAADGGTIFLDEIGELEMSLQAKLLRIIQTRQFERVGSNETQTSNVRIISATNRDLKQATLERLFREDLYFRLASFTIMLPPLRERKSDILLLAEFFLNKFSRSEGKPVKTFSRKSLKLLYEYSWPGNVRELEHAVERALLLADNSTIECEDLPLSVQAFGQGDDLLPRSGNLFESGDAVLPFESMKEMAIRHALKSTEGNIVDAAKKLKIGRATLYRLMKKHHIDE